MKTRPGVHPGRGRRAVDVMVSVLALVLLTPMLGVIALSIAMTSGSPVLFRQDRLGQGGAPFTVYKFRTMSAPAGGSEVTLRGDPRSTWIGRLLRSTSLDELPQLLNVLRGDMTLVGPRPETRALAARYPSDCVRVFDYRPGLTGPAQIHLRDREVLPEGLTEKEVEAYYIREVVPRRVALDMEYLQNPTLRQTFRLLLQTAKYLVTPSAGGTPVSSA